MPAFLFTVNEFNLTTLTLGIVKSCISNFKIFEFPLPLISLFNTN